MPRRAEAAPAARSAGNGDGGTPASSVPAATQDTESSIHSENGFGSSSEVPGASAEASGKQGNGSSEDEAGAGAGADASAAGGAAGAGNGDSAGEDAIRTANVSSSVDRSRPAAHRPGRRCGGGPGVRGSSVIAQALR